MSSSGLLEVDNLRKRYVVRDRMGQVHLTHALGGVSFAVSRGETLGLVGESGCGKTTLARTVLRLIEPDSGNLVFDGIDFTRAEMLPYRRKMQIIFQNAVGSFNPRHRIHDIVAEGMLIHKISSKAEQSERVQTLLEMVGLEPGCSNRFPHEFSGGQQQRIGIARALAVEPEFLVCDEPISSLDVSYQSQIVNLLVSLQKERGLTYLFISHELPVVRYISNRIGVMYQGRLLELGESDEIVSNPVHPYTRNLLAAVPNSGRKSSLNENATHQIHSADAGKMSVGCCYQHFCPHKPLAVCLEEEPRLVEVSSGHYCACYASGGSE